MTPKNFVITAISACALLVASQAALAGKVEKKYIYHGDEGARSICIAIAKNQVNRLSRSLRANKSGVIDHQVHKRFTCNDKDLLSFAEEVGAMKVTRYLAPKFDADAKTQIVSARPETGTNCAAGKSRPKSMTQAIDFTSK